ncbi:MAG: outer membrane beta-barrel protein [Bacteroidia bacterium]
MKSSNKLNNALRNALKEKPGELHESQWERIQSELNQKKKKGILPWLLLLIPVVLISIVSGYFIGKNSGRTELATETKQSEILNTDSNDLSKDLSKPNSLEVEKMSDELLDESDKQVENIKKNQIATQAETNENPRTLANKSDKAASKTISNKEDKEANENRVPNLERNKGEHISVVQALSMAEMKRQQELEIANVSGIDLIEDKLTDTFTKDTTEENGKNDKKSGNSDDESRFAIGFSTGFSPVTSKLIELSNVSKLHQDTRKVFEQSNDRQNSLFAKFTFDYKLSKAFNLGIGSGIEYRQVYNSSQIDYTLNEIPFREVNGDILFYIHVDDSMNPTRIQMKQQNVLQYINIPLQVSYSFPIKKGSEVAIQAGVNLALLAKSKGQTFDLNGSQILELKDMINTKASLGYIMGLQYRREIFEHWWLGGEILFQDNGQNYNLGYGSLRSRIQMRNINLNLHYKF